MVASKVVDSAVVGESLRNELAEKAVVRLAVYALPALGLMMAETGGMGLLSLAVFLSLLLSCHALLRPVAARSYPRFVLEVSLLVAILALLAWRVLAQPFVGASEASPLTGFITPELVKYLLVYALTLLLALSETLPLSVSAMLGALLMAWFGLNDGLFTYDEVFTFIDLKLLALLIGVMLTVETVSRSGLFRILGLYAVKLVGGNPRVLFVVLSFLSAATSLFLSDAAAVLILSATALAIARELEYDPVPYVVASALMINLGGTGTLIGSVSNMIIGLSAGFDFVEFAAYLLPCEFALWWLTVALLYVYYRKRLARAPKAPLEYRVAVEDKLEVFKASMILAVMIALYVSSDTLGVPAEAVAVFTAVLALTTTRHNPVEILSSIDWDTVFFVSSFLVLVNGLERTGILGMLARAMYAVSGGNVTFATLLTLFVSGITSIFLANVAVALTFVSPIRELQLPDMRPIWSALVLGTNLGGASIPVTSVVFAMAVGALRREGLEVDMGELTRVGTVTSIAQLFFAAVYLLTYFRLPL